MVDETLLLACNDGVIIVQYNVIIQSLFILNHPVRYYCIGIERVMVIIGVNQRPGYPLISTLQ